MSGVQCLCTVKDRKKRGKSKIFQVLKRLTLEVIIINASSIYNKMQYFTNEDFRKSRSK